MNALDTLIVQDTPERKVRQVLARFPISVLNLLVDKGHKVIATNSDDEALTARVELFKSLVNKGCIQEAFYAISPDCNGITMIDERTAYIFKPTPGVVSHEVCHLIDIALGSNAMWSHEHQHKLLEAFNEAAHWGAPFSEYLRLSKVGAEVAAEMLRMYFDIPEVSSGSPNLLWPEGGPGKELLRKYCLLGYNLIDKTLRDKDLLHD